MPQLDISTYIAQLFWLFVTFGLLYGLMALFFLPKISKIINKRNHQIESLLEKAESMRIAAADIDYEINHELEKVKQEVKKKFELQIEKYNKKFSQEMMRLEDELADKTHIAESRANEFKLRAMVDLEKTIVEAVLSMYKSIMKKDLNELEAENYVKTAIFDTKIRG